ncbi:hypothetical protein ACP70R_020455 [Stipagrostis hirtigluma subsp. patula]
MAAGSEAKVVPAAMADGHRMITGDVVVDDDDELFDLDIALLDRHHDEVDVDEGYPRGHNYCAAAAAVEDRHGHALLANCLLPVSSVSSAVPVPASSIFVSSYPYSGYYNSSRRLFAGGGGSSKRFLGRSAGSSARFCFSGRGFDATGNFQR